MGTSTDRDGRRILLLIVAILLLLFSGVVSWTYGDSGSAKVAASATGRIGLVLGALWLAWPSLRRPAQWLPPGFAMAVVIVLVGLAAQPRLIIVAAPALAALLALATVIRSMKR